MVNISANSYSIELWDRNLHIYDVIFIPFLVILWRNFQLLTLCRLYSKRANSQTRKSALELLAQLAQIKDGVVSEILTDSLFCVLLSMADSDEQVRVAAQLAIVALSTYLSGNATSWCFIQVAFLNKAK